MMKDLIIAATLCGALGLSTHAFAGALTGQGSGFEGGAQSTAVPRAPEPSEYRPPYNPTEFIGTHLKPSEYLVNPEQAR